MFGRNNLYDTETISILINSVHVLILTGMVNAHNSGANSHVGSQNMQVCTQSGL